MIIIPTLTLLVLSQNNYLTRGEMDNMEEWKYDDRGNKSQNNYLTRGEMDTMKNDKNANNTKVVSK